MAIRIAIIAAALAIGAGGTFAASITAQEARAIKGEAANHISTQSTANQSPQGAANSGICTV